MKNLLAQISARIPAPWAHRLGHLYLHALNLKSARVNRWQSFSWRGLDFANPLGTSGGVDKNAQFLKAWWACGAGFIEVGTCTPRPQKANPGPTLARHHTQKALWNRLGFPNHGAARVALRLEKLQRKYHGASMPLAARSQEGALQQATPQVVMSQNVALQEATPQGDSRSRSYPTPVFVNIGKNRNTPNNEAVKDYLLCMHMLAPVTDVFVINISSPNTQGLRELLKPTNLKNFLTPIAKAKQNTSTRKPILLKLSPDVEVDELKHALDVSLQLGLDGWVLTNTSSQLSAQLGFVKSAYSTQPGGVSGAPLAPLALKSLQTAVQHLGLKTFHQNEKTKVTYGGPLLVSSGGVLTREDVHQRLQAGAHLVQVYTALVFNGPQFFSNL